MKVSDVYEAPVLSFSSADALYARPLFRDGVMATGTKPSRVLGSYRFDAAVRCGLKGCDQIHQHGYLVLVADGVETNTGWDCGLDHFGVEFLAMRKEYDRAEREYLHREPLRQAIADAERVRKRIHALQAPPHGGEWLLRNLRRFAKLYPAALIETVRQHAREGEVNVFESRLRAHLEHTAVAAGSASAKPNPAHYVHQPRGTVRGLKIFTLDVDHWPLYELELELNEFQQLNADTLRFDQVLHWSEWSKNLELHLADHRYLIEEGRKFFRRDNLALLQYLAEDAKTQEQLSWIVLRDPVGATVPVKTKPRQAKRSNSWQRMLKRLMSS